MNKLKSIIALSIVVFIPFGLMIWIRNHQSTPRQLDRQELQNALHFLLLSVVKNLNEPI